MCIRFLVFSETTIDKHRVSVQRLRLQDYEQHHCDKEVLIQSCESVRRPQINTSVFGATVKRSII